MYCYKVVVVENGKRMSACINPFVLEDAYRIEYKPNEWTKPKIQNSYLFCFADLESAKHFMSLYDSDVCPEIWKCQIKGKRTPPIYVGKGRIESYWEGISHLIPKKKKLSRWNLINFLSYKEIGANTPENTILAKEIKLIEKVV